MRDATTSEPGGRSSPPGPSATTTQGPGGVPAGGARRGRPPPALLVISALSVTLVIGLVALLLTAGNSPSPASTTPAGRRLVTDTSLKAPRLVERAPRTQRQEAPNVDPAGPDPG